MVWAGYAKALALGMEQDGLMQCAPDSLYQITSYEAAAALIRLAKDRPHLSEQERTDLKRAETAVHFFQGLRPPGIVTPIVFSFHPSGASGGAAGAGEECGL